MTVPVSSGTLKDLLFRPRATLSLRVEADPNPWIVPFLGFSFASFMRAAQEPIRLDIGMGPAGDLLVLAFGALLIGGWMWAGIYGGALHIGALLLGGKKGPSGTIRAAGYAVFWPGLVGAVVLSMELLFGKGKTSEGLSLVASVLVAGCGFWSVYTVVASLRAWHTFSWLRAISSYAITDFLSLGVVVLLIAVFGLLLR